MIGWDKMRGLSDFEKYKILRPIIGGAEYDENEFPIIRKTVLDENEWTGIKAVNLQNARPSPMNQSSILLMFSYDSRLIALWNNPLKKVPLFQSYYAVASPDFSIYPGMNINDIRQNIYMSRWLGRTWQNYGCKVYPTIGWYKSDTYDICFSAVEKGSIVVISTLGCLSNKEVFLQGFKEMKKRLQPSLIVVFGEMIDGMTGKFVNFRYQDSFRTKYYQFNLDGISQIYEISEA